MLVSWSTLCIEDIILSHKLTGKIPRLKILLKRIRKNGIISSKTAVNKIHSPSGPPGRSDFSLLIAYRISASFICDSFCLI